MTQGWGSNRTADGRTPGDDSPVNLAVAALARDWTPAALTARSSDDYFGLPADGDGAPGADRDVPQDGDGCDGE
jgi:hypothetical protein